MKNYFLLFLFLWIGTIDAQNSNFFVQQKTNSIYIPSDAIRQLVETKDFTTTLNFCDLTIGEDYLISIRPMDNHNCHPQLYLTQQNLVENQSNRMVFTASADCEFVDLSNICGSIHSTYYYISIFNTSVKKDALLKSMGIMTLPENPEILVRDVFLKGDCVVVENITYQGNNNAIGRFTGGDSVIGMEEGIIITSGAVNLASGPNEDTGTSTPWGDETGDENLAANEGAIIVDAAVLEFDFTPIGNRVSFDFVFASEEYCDFIDAQFNDAFGFYLTGPGHNANNIARVNGNGPLVSIDSINHLQNAQYFVDNVPPNQGQIFPCLNHTPIAKPSNLSIEYDGFTVKLSTIAEVEPCVPYHIKFAIGDAEDGFFDSAVFLGANSFDAALPVSIRGLVDSEDSLATEGCDNASLVFTRENPLFREAVELNYTISSASTATSGLDYEALSGSIILAADSHQVEVPIIIISDELAEDIETIVIELRTSLCGNFCEDDVQTVIIEIQDGTGLTVDLPSVSTCGENSATLSPTITDGSGDYSYQWNNDSTDPTLDVNLTNTPTIYSVTVIDNNSCAVGVALIEVSGDEAPEATIDGNIAVCEEPVSETFLVNFTGNAPWRLEYNINGNAQTPITNITNNPYELLASEIGIYTLNTVSTNDCLGITSGEAIIELIELELITVSNDVNCSGESDGTASVTINGGTAPYNIEWSNGDNETEITNLEAGIYDVSITDVNNCLFITSIEINEPMPLVAVVSVSTQPDCENPTGGGAFLNVSGGTEPYTFAWDNGTTGQNLQNVSSGIYQVFITDNVGCTSTESIEITASVEQPNAVASSPSDINCDMPQVTLSGAGSSDGTYLWTTDNGNILNGETTLTPTINQGGTYTLMVTNVDNTCSAITDVMVEENISNPVVSIVEPDSLTCEVTQLVLDATNSDNGPNYSFEWNTTDGGMISGGATTLNPTITTAGTYILTIIDNMSHCEVSTSITILENNTSPEITTGTDYLLTCSDESLTISANTNVDNATYQWTTEDGTIITGATDSDLEIMSDGTYIVIITNTDNACSNSSSIEVSVDRDMPIVEIAVAEALTCNTTSLILNANGSDFGNDFIINWSTDTGNFLEGQETLTPTIDEPGNYTLLITNNTNACTDTSNILIEQNITTANVDAGQTQTLDCTVTNISLNGSIDLDNRTILWTTNNGNILDGETTLTPTINAAGIYTLTITNPENGCHASDNVDIELDPSVPEILIEMPNMLTCETTSMVLDASQTTADQNLVFQWTSSNGNIVTGANTSMPTIDEAGNYVLTIFIGDNCTNTSAIEVIENTEEPIADAGTDFTINCTEPSRLNGTNSSIGSIFMYEWRTNNGEFNGSTQTIQPSINGGGLYTLTVLNTQNSCSTSDVVNVIDDAPESVESLAIDPDCFNSFGSFGINSVSGGTVPYLYSIDGGATFQASVNFPDLTSGTYNFVVQDANDCTYEESFEIANDTELNLSLESFVTIDLGESYQINALVNIPMENIASIQWSPVDSTWSCTDCLTPQFFPTETATYTLSITDTNACKTTANIDIFVNKEVPIYIPNAFSPTAETNTTFTIHAKEDRIKNIKSLQIFDYWGGLVFSNENFEPNDFENGWNGTYLGKILNPAVFIYWTEIELQNGQIILLKGEISIIK